MDKLEILGPWGTQHSKQVEAIPNVSGAIPKTKFNAVAIDLSGSGCAPDGVAHRPR